MLLTRLGELSQTSNLEIVMVANFSCYQLIYINVIMIPTFPVETVQALSLSRT